MIILFLILLFSIIGIVTFFINKLLIFCVIGAIAAFVYIILYSKETIITTIGVAILIVVLTPIRYTFITFTFSLCIAATIDICSGILCMIPAFIKSVSKSIKIAKISKIIDTPSLCETGIDKIVAHKKVKEDAYKELYSYIESNPDLNQIMQDYCADRDTLKEIHQTLLALGAGQWVDGHFVAISALAFKGTLEYLLVNKDILLKQDMDNFEESNKICDRIIQYFEQGETGYIY